MTVASALLASALALSALPALAGTITFDGVPPGPIQGQTINGVTFDNVSGAVVGTPPSALPGISGPALLFSITDSQPVAGTFFELDFGPATAVSFSYALSVPAGRNFSGVVTFLAAGFGFTLAQFPLGTSANGPGIAAGTFSQTFSGLPAGSVQVGISLVGTSSFAPTLMALDNISVTPVPEPDSALLAGLGLLGVAAWVATRRRPLGQQDERG
jgi:hypothetical protein